MNNIKQIFAIVLLGLAACSSEESSQAVSELNQSNPELEVQLTRLKKQLISDVVECTGLIDVPPNMRAALYAPIGSNIHDIRILPGDDVKKGQVLFSLSHQDLVKIQEDYLLAINSVKLEEVNYERKEKLFEANNTSERDLRQAKYDYEVAKANLSSLKAQLNIIGISPEYIVTNGIQNKIWIKAPISGYISNVEAVAGAYVDMNSKILTIVNTEHKHVELDIYTDKIKGIQVGQQVGFHTAGSEIEYSAEIYLIGKEVNEDTRTVSVHAHLDHENGDALVVGSFLYAGVLVNADSLFSITEQAIVEAEGKYYILVKNGELLEPHEVELGMSFKGNVEIKNFAELLDAEIVAKDAYYFME